MPFRFVLPALISLSIGVAAKAQQAEKPFPQHVRYHKGTIKPDHITQQQSDGLTLDFYRQWKQRYIKTGCNANEYYVWFERKGEKQCVSEGQGYGMVITVLMAGADPSAKVTYDGLFNYYKAHRNNHGYLMAWAQNKNCRNIDQSSATDGDMDIAYSLLLADKQWGSKGNVNYLKESRNIIGAIMKYEINPKTWSVKLSDAVEYDSKDYFDMRSSDFMPANFKAFERATGDIRWGKVVNNNYELFAYMARTYSADAGLIPDFIININNKAKPAQPHFLESKYDGYYNYNACRVPWRIATDYLMTGDPRAKAINDRINGWIRQTTSGNPDNISAGYTLAGNDIKGRYFEALSFIGPFAVSAMVDKKNQKWLNAVWDYLVNFKLKDYDYYDNSIKLLDMIILSGNYWEPR
ncbi:glycosyl hydrolase family 8 [Mucilaginibacter sp.]|jgi:endo-1,4-beta-D-glucanase Y|uniref:glycosyl hydrolase family 8 n=1 Tax=Mucilaginibacter sp. TaxID=1882438 RepID=UPI002CB0EDBB|nr:glycosyl hydrolase family 8 [Mucilaginibacter sp.]HTI61101.1 glycosyl hydrolase family 8 [Mucilaginibacter sp.]